MTKYSGLLAMLEVPIFMINLYHRRSYFGEPGAKVLMLSCYPYHFSFLLSAQLYGVWFLSNLVKSVTKKRNTECQSGIGALVCLVWYNRNLRPKVSGVREVKYKITVEGNFKYIFSQKIPSNISTPLLRNNEQ